MVRNIPHQDLVQVDKESFDVVAQRSEADVVHNPEEGSQVQNFFSYGLLVAKHVSDEEGDKYFILQATNKKTVYYDKDRGAYIEVGRRASVFPFNHTSLSVRNSYVCNTSTVLKQDVETGAFETLNTHYVPLTVEEFQKLSNPQEESNNGQHPSV